MTEQKKGAYKYFVDLGERMEVATSRTVYIDEDRQDEVDKTKMVYGMSVGAAADDDDDHSGGTRVVDPGQRVRPHSTSWCSLTRLSGSHFTRRKTSDRSEPLDWNQVRRFLSPL